MSTKRYKPEQIVYLLCRIEGEIANGKATPQAARRVTCVLVTVWELIGLVNTRALLVGGRLPGKPTFDSQCTAGVQRLGGASPQVVFPPLGRRSFSFPAGAALHTRAGRDPTLGKMTTRQDGMVTAQRKGYGGVAGGDQASRCRDARRGLQGDSRLKAVDAIRAT
jgi:hypothetical protein